MSSPGQHDITPEAAAALLMTGRYLPSQGIGWGCHWRTREGLHLRHDLEGRWTLHADETDPRGGLLPFLRHLLVDVLGIHR